MTGFSPFLWRMFVTTAPARVVCSRGSPGSSCQWSKTHCGKACPPVCPLNSAAKPSEKKFQLCHPLIMQCNVNCFICKVFRYLVKLKKFMSMINSFEKNCLTERFVNRKMGFDAVHWWTRFLLFFDHMTSSLWQHIENPAHYWWRNIDVDLVDGFQYSGTRCQEGGKETSPGRRDHLSPLAVGGVWVSHKILQVKLYSSHVFFT